VPDRPKPDRRKPERLNPDRRKPGTGMRQAENDREAERPGRETMLRAAVADLPPAYFALTMATGILSIAAAMQGFELLAQLLFGLNIAAYVILWLLSLLRLAWYPQRLLADLADHGRGPGFFTIVAGT